MLGISRNVLHPHRWKCIRGMILHEAVPYSHYTGGKPQKINLKWLPLGATTPEVGFQPALGSLLSCQVRFRIGAPATRPSLLSEPKLVTRFQMTWQQSFSQTSVGFARPPTPTRRGSTTEFWGLNPTTRPSVGVTRASAGEQKAFSLELGLDKGSNSPWQKPGAGK